MILSIEKYIRFQSTSYAEKGFLIRFSNSPSEFTNNIIDWYSIKFNKKRYNEYDKTYCSDEFIEAINRYEGALKEVSAFV